MNLQTESNKWNSRSRSKTIVHMQMLRVCRKAVYAHGASWIKTGKHDHKAYESSDGVDPEWALFYAGYFQAKIWDRLGGIPTRSEIIHFLLDADEAFRATGKEYMESPAYYAKLYIEKHARD